MTWNWEETNWPNFTYDASRLEKFEKEFFYKAGTFSGVLKYFDTKEKQKFQIEILCEEAYKTSMVEGELLNRISLQSSIQKNFGLKISQRTTKLNESGIAELMTELYRNFNRRLKSKDLHRWNALILYGKDNFLPEYRTDSEPMQIISGPIHAPRVHFEAVPSTQVNQEMSKFIRWFNHNHFSDTSSIPALARAGIAHLYFVSIHPYDDGNGRIARALATKSLSLALGHPSLIAFSHVVEKYRKQYYQALDLANKNLEITTWLEYFAETVIKAQDYSHSLIEFLLKKTKFYQKFSTSFNPRQAKVIDRIWEEGLDGFKGGLSAENYISITKTSRATATRDLQELINLGALIKTGELKSTRYFIK